MSDSDLKKGFYSAKTIIVQSQRAWIAERRFPYEVEELLLKVVSIGESVELRKKVIFYSKREKEKEVH